MIGSFGKIILHVASWKGCYTTNPKQVERSSMEVY